MSLRDRLIARTAASIDALGVDHRRSGTAEWTVAVPSQMRGEISVLVGVREHNLRLSAFIMRRAEENHAAVYSGLLARHMRTWLWRFALDDAGDLFAVADVPGAALAEEDFLDRALGALSTLVDESYEAVVRDAFDVPPGTRFGPAPPAVGDG